MEDLDPLRKGIQDIPILNMDGSMSNTSGVTAETLKARIEEKLEASFVEIKDMSGGCGQMFEAIIVSPQFAKKMTLARHRLVNSALKTEVAAIHAWTPKCYTPEEWTKKTESEKTELS